MQNATGSGIVIEPDDRNHAHRSVVSDLVSLIEHVRASLKLIESAVAREISLGSQETSADIIVLDDVTPPYVKATAALNACDAHLAIALRSLLDSKAADHDASDLAWDRPALSILSA
jgi:hypothetical protein